MKKHLLILSTILFFLVLFSRAEAHYATALKFLHTESIPTITASTATGSIIACAGTASASPDIQQFTVSGGGLTANITVTATNGFEVSLTTGSGYANSVTIPQTSGSVSNIVVYVRSAATAATGSVSGNITLTSAGAANQTVAVSGTVNPLPTVNAVANQTVNAGATTAAVNFTGTGNTFTWTNDMPGIGLAASGSGNIAAFATVNTGSSPVLATVTVTPVNAEYAYIPCAGSGVISLINLNTLQYAGQIQGVGEAVSVAVSSDGTRAFFTGGVGGGEVVNTSDNTIIGYFTTGLDPWGIAVSPDGKRVYVANQGDNTVSVIDALTLATVTKIPVGLNPYGIAVSPDGGKVVVSNLAGGTITVINALTNTVVASPVSASYPGGLCFTPDGSRLYVANILGGCITVFNMSNNTLIKTISVGSHPTEVVISPDGKTAYVSNGNSDNLSVISTETNNVTNIISTGSGPEGLSITTDGKYLFETNVTSNDVWVIDAITQTVVQKIGVGFNPWGFGNFISPIKTCPGTPITFTITVNPPGPAITATTATGTISTCAGTASTSPNIQQFTVSGSGLTSNITATAPPGFEVSLSTGSDYGNSVTLTQTGGALNNTKVYVRSAATAATGSISGNITLTSAGAANQTVAVAGTVNALPTVNTVPNQTVNAGAATAAVNFTGAGNTFTWTNDTPGIGLAASGTGNIASFTAVNTGSSPVVATITATPINSGFAYIANQGDGSSLFGSVDVINIATKAVVAKIQVGINPFAISVSPDGSRVYVTNTGSNTVSVINALTNTVSATINVGQTPQGVAISPDGSRIYVSNGNSGTVSVINTANNLVIGTITVGSNPWGVKVSPDGAKVYVTNNASNTVSVISTATNAVISTIAVGLNPAGLTTSPDGNMLYVANYVSRSISVISTSNNQVVSTIPAGCATNEIAISPDGAALYVADYSYGSVEVFNTATGNLSATINGVGTEPESLFVTPDGKEVYITNNDDFVCIINTATDATSRIDIKNSQFSFGNFISNSGCPGTPTSFTITVNPPGPSITATAAVGAIAACAGTTPADPGMQQFTVSGNNLTGNITATTPTGFEISLSAGNGYGNSVTIIPASGIAANTPVYVRLASTASAGNFSGNVTLTSAGAPDQNVAVSGTVNALPTVNAIADQIVNAGASTAAVNFTGTAATYSWVNDKPAIGLAAKGTGDIAAFTAVNPGTNPVVATVTVTPKAAGLAFIPNQHDNSVSVINVLSNTVVATIPVGNTPSGVAISPDNSRAYITNQLSHTVSVIDISTFAIVATIPVGISAYAITITPDGSQVYVANANSNSISVINTATNTVVKAIPVGPDPFGMAMSQDGKTLYVTDQQAISIISTVTNAVIGSINIGVRSLAIVVSPDGSKLYVTNPVTRVVTVINAASRGVIATIGVGDGDDAITISPDGNFVYVANQTSGNVSVINTTTNSVVATITVGMLPTGLSLNADGSLLYVANDGSNSVTVINTATNTVLTEVAVGNVPNASGNFVSTGGGCPGAPVTFTITVNPPQPTIIAGSISGTISACAGNASTSPNIQQFTVSGVGLSGSITATSPPDFEVSLAAGSGYGASVVLPQTGGAVSSAVIYVRSSAGASSGSISGNVTLTSAVASDQTVAVSGTVNTMVVPSLSIAASGNYICAGTPVTFTATPTNGGSAPVYQWLLNGNNAGTNSATFSSTTLANGDVVSCVMTSNSTCVTPATATSNSITMAVNAVVAPSISIAASQNAICAGTPVTFTATPVNGGIAPFYQWQLNGTNAGSNSATFASSSLADGDIITCVITSNAACATPVTATSNSLTMRVSPSVSPAVSIAASLNNICAGNNVSFTATPTNGGSAPVYQWLLNGNSTGTNSETYASSSLANGDVITCQLTSNATCLAAPNATSNGITMVVNPEAASGVSISIAANNVCAGTPLSFTATPNNGGSTPAYQWLVNGNNTGTNSPTFSSVLNNGDAVTCVLSSNLACATPASATSNSITAIVAPLPTVNGGGNKTVEKGSSTALTATASGDITRISWSPATGLDNNTILNPTASPAATTQYTITVQTAEGCDATDEVTVTVLDGIIIPNTFTPNGDGINDKWNIQNLADYQNCVVQVFDRYGGEVYTSKGYSAAWDGTENGRRLPVGTYYYLINLNDGSKPLSGFVVLIR